MTGFFAFLRGRFGLEPFGTDKQSLVIWLFDRRRRRAPELRGVTNAANLPILSSGKCRKPSWWISLMRTFSFRHVLFQNQKSYYA